MISIGIDSGSTTTKGVVYDGQKIIKKMMILTGANPRRTMNDIYNELYMDGAFVVTTGYGRNLLEGADKVVTEITCHGKGACYLNPEVRTVIDIGGQDSKVILLDQDHYIKDFLMNDKCAAGTGRFMEVIMRLLQEDLADIDDYVKDAVATKISSMCTVFAESEVVSLLAHDVSGASIAKGVIEAIALRTANFAKRLPIEGKVFFSGGLAHSHTMKKCIETYLNEVVVSHADAQYVGAIGAAVIGYDHIKRMNR